MGIEVVQSAETAVLRLKGSWTIERANELKHALMDALKGGDQIIIELEELMEVDLSSLQLLCSAHRTSLKLGKRMALHERQSEPFSRVVREAGFGRTLGCHKDPQKSCLWIGGWQS
jgi:anti-anti-sigma factor